MIIKLLGTILSLVVLAFFIGFNLDNKCNVNVLFYTFQNVPVFITIIISFVVGVLFTMPFAFSYKAEKKKQLKAKNVTSKETKKKSLFNNKKAKALANKTDAEESQPKQNPSSSENTEKDSLDSGATENDKVNTEGQ